MTVSARSWSAWCCRHVRVVWFTPAQTALIDSGIATNCVDGRNGRAGLTPPRDASGDNVHPERETNNGRDNPGANPDQQDDKKTSSNGKGQR